MDLMKIDPEVVKRLRDQRAWSQEHLSAASGLSLRTIQRVESEASASAETRMALAAAFGVELAQLGPQPPASALDEIPPAISTPHLGPALTDKGRMSYLQYRLLRLGVIVGALVALDVMQSGRITWSRWVLMGGAVLLALRWIKSQYVVPGRDRGRGHRAFERQP